MIESSQLKQDSDGQWWVLIKPHLEVFFETCNNRPSEIELNIANSAVAEINQLIQQAIEYIDIWVDRTREGTGTEYELHSLYVIPEGQTKLQFHFVADEGSQWWVLFNNPTAPYVGGKPKYWPVAFGRNQN